MSLVEVILALALFSVIVVAVISSQWGVEDLGRNNAQRIIAHNFAFSGLIKLILNPSDWSAGETMPALFEGIENKSHKENFSQCEDVFQSTSNWMSGWGSTSTVAFSVLNDDIETAEKYGLDCGGHPKRFNLEKFESVESVELDSYVNSLDIFRDWVYVGLKTVESSDTDILVINPSPPYEIRNSFDTGEIVNKIDVANGYVFAAQNSSTTQFAVLDGRNSDLSLVATSSLPGVAGARPGAVSIFYFDSYIYVGTKRTAGREFHVFDVEDPTAPVWLGSLEVNHNINDIQVKNGFAFLATSGNIRDIIILDIRDPAHIVQVSAIDLPGNEDGRTVHVSGNKIYLGRYQGASANHDELFVFEFSVKENGDFGEIVTLGSASTRSDITDIAVSAGTIFVTTNTQNGLRFFEFNKIGELVQVGNPLALLNGTAIDYEDKVYVVSTENNLHFFKQE